MKSESASDSRGQAPLLVCFSQLRWGFVYQRPHHLMTRAARTHRVIFWEEPMLRPEAGPELARFPQNERLEVVTPILPEHMDYAAQARALASLLEERLAEERGPLDICWFVTPMMLEFAGHLRPQVTVYDNMDELSAFRNAPPIILEREADLLRRADVVFTGGLSIYDAKREHHANIHAMPSSIDRDHFGSARNWTGAEPEDQKRIPHPRIGWFGVIDERTDLDLVAGLVALRPEWQFVMLGPVVKIDPASLPRAANIHWLGNKDYRNLPAYLAGWDCGFMPFARNDATRFISPTKTPEYLAAGVPVVSTPIRDIMRPYADLDLVRIASAPEEMAAAIEQAVEGRNGNWLHRADAFLAGKSWDGTWAEMQMLIDEARSRSCPAQSQEVAA